MATTKESTLRALERLVGSWTTEATHPLMPGVVVHGYVEVAWAEGKKFLIHRATTDHPKFPDSISVVGFTDADSAETTKNASQLTMHYYDDRGVFRDFQASIDDKAWRFERAGGFPQRFVGTFMPDGSIDGITQLCEDGKTWRDDLKITYRRPVVEARDPDDYVRIPKKAIMIDLPNATQVTDYTCGASALLAICSYFGVGPEDEWDFEQEMAMPATGADPIHITTAAKKYGLEVKEYRPMTIKQLEKCLDKGRPVILMLQAWGDGNYDDVWTDGHYVVAIGYDDERIYVEDPSIHGSRGYVTRDELEARWHDVEGEHDHHTERLGIAIWKDEPTKLRYARSARHVD